MGVAVLASVLPFVMIQNAQAAVSTQANVQQAAAPTEEEPQQAPPSTLGKKDQADPTLGWEKDKDKADKDGKIHRGKWLIDAKTGVQTAPQATSADCLSGYACWFGDANYLGWIQRYKDVQYASYIGATYNDKMSSWWNRRCGGSEWNDGDFFEEIYQMQAGAYYSYVGSHANDTMTYFSNFAC